MVTFFMDVVFLFGRFLLLLALEHFQLNHRNRKFQNLFVVFDALTCPLLWTVTNGAACQFGFKFNLDVRMDPSISLTS